MEIQEKIKLLVSERKKKYTQKDISEMTGVSRPHIANFENGRVNNMYLYDFYQNHFGGSST